MPLLGVDEFNRAFQKFGRTLLPAAVVLVQKKIAFQALEGLVNATPVDKGRAQGNWQVSIGQPVENALPLGATGEQALSKGGGVINSIPPFGPFVIIYLTNNVPYIRRLNAGHSGQAPPMFVEKVFERLRAQFP